MGVLLVAAQRRVRRHGPAVWEVRVAVRSADIIQARELLGQRLGLAVVGAHGVDEAVGTTLLARAIVRHHQDQGVFAQARLVQEGDQAGELAVGVVEHGGKRALQPRGDRPFVGGELGPGPHAVVARRQVGVGGHDAQSLLAGEAAFALHIPTLGEDRIVAFDDRLRRLVWRVAGAEGEQGSHGVSGASARWSAMKRIAWSVRSAGSGDTRWRTSRAARSGCCRAPAPGRTGRSRRP